MSNIYIIYLIVYVIAGLVTTAATMKIFPPVEGFRPPLPLRLLAIVVFASLWPILVLLTAWYLAMGFLCRRRDQDSTAISVVEIESAKPFTSWRGSKPR